MKIYWLSSATREMPLKTIIRFQFTPARILKKKKRTLVRVDLKKLEWIYTAGGNRRCYRHLGKQAENKVFYWCIDHRITKWLKGSTSRVISK